MLANPCLTCGEPTLDGNRCKDCSDKYARIQAPRNDVRKDRKVAAAKRGYDRAWRNLSERARHLQPFCSDCGARDDLQADHSPEAWERKERGLPIRLQDIDVVCGTCNRKRGAARGESTQRRSKATEVIK